MSKKLITFAVPCYNSAQYMEKCIDSLLRAGEDAEIIIIDDGSTDRTGAIADDYADRFPTMIVAHHQENGGHGEGVNQGLRMANGVYYKVVDSDDWLAPDALDVLMDTIRRHVAEHTLPDMYVANYVYMHDDGPSHKMRYGNVFPNGKFSNWGNCGSMRLAQYFMMHSLVYRTAVLRASGMELPKHTFYVDNLYVYAPLPYVRNIFYLDIDLYMYCIGRADQSVTEANMVKRIDQQVLVSNLMIDACDFKKIRAEYPRLYKVMLHHLTMIMTISSIFLFIRGGEEDVKKHEDMWRHLKETDEQVYRKLRATVLGFITNLPGKPGRRITIVTYRIVNKIIGMN